MYVFTETESVFTDFQTTDLDDLNALKALETVIAYTMPVSTNTSSSCVSI